MEPAGFRFGAATEESVMAKGEQKGNRETKKPKKEKPKTIAAAPSTKGSGSTTTYGKK
jgi:hypothetical protein